MTRDIFRIHVNSVRIDTNLGVLGTVMSAASGKMMGKINESDTSYGADEKCDGCGICEKVCPVGNIAMTDGKPLWSHRREGCLACFHWCPRAAIQIGKKTASRGRYHHPAVELKEMLA